MGWGGGGGCWGYSNKKWSKGWGLVGILPKFYLVIKYAMTASLREANAKSKKTKKLDQPGALFLIQNFDFAGFPSERCSK